MNRKLTHKLLELPFPFADNTKNMKYGFVLSILAAALLFSSCTKDLAENSYYRNIPELSGTTRDDPPLFFIIKVDLAYAWGDKKTQISLSKLNPVIQDKLRTFFRGKIASDYAIDNEAALKQEIVKMINNTIRSYKPYKKVAGIKDVAIIKQQVFEFK